MTVGPDYRKWARVVRKAVEARDRDPVADVRWTNPQREWFQIHARLALLVGGNQFGKSWAQAGDCAMFVEGKHPVQSHAPPVKVAVASKSWKQMDPLIQKIWDLLPRRHIDPKVRYVPGQGVKGYKEPIIPLVDGPGAGSEIRLYTYDAGTQRLAGETFDRMYLDEPPPAAFWGEAVPRLNARGGYMRVSFTPTPDAPPQPHIRDMVRVWEEAGRPELGCPGGIYEHRVHLTEDACTPRGGMFELPFMSAADIEEFSALLLPYEREMRIKGAWEPILRGRVLETFEQDACVHAFPLGAAHGPPIQGTIIVVGVDHGAGLAKQAAAVIAVNASDLTRPRVWLLAERVATTYTTPEQDARAILEMLKGLGLDYDSVDYWTGDRSTNANRDGIKKGNAQLRQELARLSGRKSKWIETPHKYSGSVADGFREMKAIMARRVQMQPHLSHFLVSPTCKGFVDACQQWQGRRDDPHKDILDAVRYAMEEAFRRLRVQTSTSRVFGY